MNKVLKKYSNHVLGTRISAYFMVLYFLVAIFFLNRSIDMLSQCRWAGVSPSHCCVTVSVVMAWFNDLDWVSGSGSVTSDCLTLSDQRPGPSSYSNYSGCTSLLIDFSFLSELSNVNCCSSNLGCTIHV